MLVIQGLDVYEVLFEEEDMLTIKRDCLYRVTLVC